MLRYSEIRGIRADAHFPASITTLKRFQWFTGLRVRALTGVCARPRVFAQAQRYAKKRRKQKINDVRRIAAQANQYDGLDIEDGKTRMVVVVGVGSKQ